MSQITDNIILYEPRPLFRCVAKSCIHSCNGVMAVIEPGALTEEAYTFNNKNAVLAAGLSGASEELYTLLRLIHHLSMLGREIIVWIAERDLSLAGLMYGLGVHTLLCEHYLEEELVQRIRSPCFRSAYLPSRPEERGRGVKNIRLSDTELNMLIDCARGLNAYEIASLRHVGYKTVFTHKRNIQLRLGLEKPARWLDLLNRLEQIRSV
ncbi:LuxR C-terminal-related transcriptional regulator [Enterobacter roggenkampii]|uniref:LuxR C-terminal-related transcriptional regulator n=1 Tax=Enterobacter roggenkampii TaxID=1812935 RepID=UPI001237AA94|nr:LuxR C-terminal-related transcriptional regulator [Enterobacter roggenkampii]